MILTNQEAADTLKYNNPSELPGNVESIILPAIDGYLKEATGKDWGNLTATYTAIDPVAKLVATMLLVQWVEQPAMIGKVDEMKFGVTNLIAQLHAKALTLGGES